MDSKKKNLFIAIGLGVVALFLNKFYLSTERENLAPTNYIEVVRVGKGLEAGVVIREKDLEKAKVPQVYLPRGFISWNRRMDFLERKVATHVQSGDYLLENYFVEIEGVGARLSEQLEEGKNDRAINLPVDETNSLARSIVTGDKIDVVYTFAVPNTNQQLSTVLLQNVPVVSTGTYVISDEEQGAYGTTQRRYNSLTLRMPADDAFRLNYARQTGKISILLRHQKDSELLDLKPIRSISDLLSEEDKKQIVRISEEQKKGMSQEAEELKQKMIEAQKKRQGQ